MIFIFGFLSLIETSNLDSKTKLYLDYIKEGSDNLLDIINDVLDTAKMNEGKMDAHLDWLDLKHFFKKKVNFHLEQFKYKGLELKYKFTCDCV
jgi:two-component system, sensor histidine kinase RpfC